MAAKKANSNFMHGQLLSPLRNLFPSNSPAIPPTHPHLSPELISRIHAFASPPRHQPPKPRLFGNHRVWEQGPKGMKSHKEIAQRPKKHEILSGPQSKYVVTMGHGRVLHLPHASTPPLYHLYIISSPPTPTPRRSPSITIA